MLRPPSDFNLARAKSGESFVSLRGMRGSTQFPQSLLDEHDQTADPGRILRIDNTLTDDQGRSLYIRIPYRSSSSTIALNLFQPINIYTAAGQLSVFHIYTLDPNLYRLDHSFAMKFTLAFLTLAALAAAIPAPRGNRGAGRGRSTQAAAATPVEAVAAVDGAVVVPAGSGEAAGVTSSSHAAAAAATGASSGSTGTGTGTGTSGTSSGSSGSGHQLTVSFTLPLRECLAESIGQQQLR